MVGTSTTCEPPSATITAPVMYDDSPTRGSGRPRRSRRTRGAAQRHIGGDRRVPLLPGAEAGMRGELVHLLVGHRRLHPSGADRVDADAVAPVVARERPREADERVLADRVSGHRRPREESGQRRDDHHLPLGLDQRRQRLACHHERGGEVGADRRVPARVVGLGDRREPVSPAFATRTSIRPNRARISAIAACADAVSAASATTGRAPTARSTSCSGSGLRPTTTTCAPRPRTAPRPPRRCPCRLR